MKGFDNLKNTCYFNTSLQCLLQIPILSNHFLKNEYNGNCEFTDLYSKLVNIYWTTNNTTKVVNVSKLFRSFVICAGRSPAIALAREYHKASGQSA